MSEKRASSIDLKVDTDGDTLSLLMGLVGKTAGSFRFLSDFEDNLYIAGLVDMDSARRTISRHFGRRRTREYDHEIRAAATKANMTLDDQYGVAIKKIDSNYDAIAALGLEFSSAPGTCWVLYGKIRRDNR